MTTQKSTSFETQVKAAAVIVVAVRIFEDAMKRPASPNKLLRTQLAGDVMDKTMPSVHIAQRYPNKPDDQGDADFLLHNLDLVGVLEPAAWPPRRVPMSAWAEYTRAVRGLESYLKLDATNKKPSKLESADIEGMLSFIAPALSRIPDVKIRAALARESFPLV